MKKAIGIFKKMMPAIIISLAGSFVCICCALTVIPAKGETVSAVNSGIVRFRVVANSDSDYDQLLKIKVRDGLGDSLKSVFSECTSSEEIRTAFRENKGFLEETAERILADNGENTNVNVRFVTEKAPVRRYDDVVLPAGKYMTLRVDIGNAKGKNWWCVMYPSAYLEKAFDNTGDDINVSSSEKSVSKPKKVRFALFDLFS